MAEFQASGASLRKAYYVSMVVLGVLLLGSIVWYRQRISFVDPAWISFEVIQKGKLSIPEHRYGAIASQIWLLVGSWIHVPIGLLTLLYSASFYIFYVIVAWVIGHKLEQYALGILLVMYHTLIVSDVYFWPNNEVHQGVGWMMLFLGVFAKYQTVGRAPVWAHVVMIVSLFLALFSHFIVIVPFTFLGIYWLLNEQEYLDTRAKKIQLACCLLAIAAIFLIKLNMGRSGWYDREKLLPVLHLTFAKIVDSFGNGGSMTMEKLIKSNYWIIAPIFLSGIAMQVWLRKWKLLLLTLAYVVGYFSLVCLTYAGAYGRELQFYMESEWMAWGILLATPFVVHVVPRLKPKLALLALVLIFVVRLGYIYRSFLFFDERYRTISGIVDVLHSQGISKAYVMGEKEERNAIFLMDWASAYESLIISAMKGHDPQVSFYLVDTKPVSTEPTNAYLLSAYSRDTVDHLNQHYFHMDGKNPYQVLQLKDVMQRMKR
jgi:hypothetical protein